MPVTSNIMKNVSNFVRSSRPTLFSELVEIYKPAISHKKNRLVEVMKEKAELAGISDVAGKLKVAKEYWKLEVAPPTQNSEMQTMIQEAKLVRDFFKSGAYNMVTVKQAFLAFVISLEIALWFYLGETIGKLHLIGYSV